MTEKEKLIDEILDRELEMFLNVRSREPASCQQDPKAFRFFRSAQFHVWSERTLKSYLQDLKQAKEENKNLMTLKYARMEGIVPQINDSRAIDEIVNMETGWIKELFEKYPNIISRGRPLEDDGTGGTSFKTYLRGELETYSNATLELLYEDMKQYRQKGENMTEKIYLEMIRGYGFKSLEEAEERLSKK
jgi:hypothetical protein